MMMVISEIINDNFDWICNKYDEKRGEQNLDNIIQHRRKERKKKKNKRKLVQGEEIGCTEYPTFQSATSSPISFSPNRGIPSK